MSLFRNNLYIFTITGAKKIVCYIEVCYIEVPLHREHEVKNRNRKWSLRKQKTANRSQELKTATVIRARKKKKNFSLSLGQEALTFCWTEATTCSS